MGTKICQFGNKFEVGEENKIQKRKSTISFEIVLNFLYRHINLLIKKFKKIYLSSFSPCGNLKKQDGFSVEDQLLAFEPVPGRWGSVNGEVQVNKFACRGGGFLYGEGN